MLCSGYSSGSGHGNAGELLLLRMQESWAVALHRWPGCVILLRFASCLPRAQKVLPEEQVRVGACLWVEASISTLPLPDLCSFDVVCFFDPLQHVLVGGESGSSYSSESRPLTPTAAEEYARCRHTPRIPRRICPFLQVWPGFTHGSNWEARRMNNLPPPQQPLQHSPGSDPGL